MGVYEELVNRRIQLKATGDPNLNAGLNGALPGTGFYQTDASPTVIWRKERTGANGWDVEQVLPTEPAYIRYVDQTNTAPGQNGSFENPFSSLQDAYDSIPSAISTADFMQTYYVDVISELETFDDWIIEFDLCLVGKNPDTNLCLALLTSAGTKGIGLTVDGLVTGTFTVDSSTIEIVEG